MAVVVRGRIGTTIGRGMAWSVGQIAVSVVATLIASEIYHAMRAPDAPQQADRQASVTTGGKFDARIAGAALPPIAEPARPVLSIVNWAITPINPTEMVDDVAWTGVESQGLPHPEPGPKPARHDPRRTTVAVAPAPVVRPVLPSVAELPAAPTAPAAERPVGLLAVAGDTVRTVSALGGSVVAFGGAALGHLLPDHH